MPIADERVLFQRVPGRDATPQRGGASGHVRRSHEAAATTDERGGEHQPFPKPQTKHRTAQH